MKLAIISDLHFGDSSSSLSVYNKHKDGFYKEDKYARLVETIKKNCNNQPLDYLVLLGDIFDFSVASYEDAYRIGQFFFENIKRDNLANEIIYVPGNHDFDLWHIVENQVQSIKKMEKGMPPQPFRFSVPGIINDRQKSGLQGLTLHNVPERKSRQDDDLNNNSKYGGLYLDNITLNKTGKKTTFNFVYPNLYLITDSETILLTHGQYFDPYWSFTGKWAPKIFQDDLKVKTKNQLNLKEMAAFNFPLCHFNCAGIGQAGTLTELIQKQEHKLKERNVEDVEKYLSRIDNEIKRNNGFVRGSLYRLAYKIATKVMLKSLKTADYSRYRDNFLKDKNVRQRVRDYIRSSFLEIDILNSDKNYNIPLPNKMIFGHTHEPIGIKSGKAIELDKIENHPNHKITMYNTGGWIYKEKNVFAGAEIFFYETNKGLSSVRID